MPMSATSCPVCEQVDVVAKKGQWECLTCGHEWTQEATAGATDGYTRIVKDAHGQVLTDGDTVTLIKDLKLKGSSQMLKQGTRVKNIRLVDGDHEIDCRIDGSAMALKAMFVKKG